MTAALSGSFELNKAWFSWVALTLALMFRGDQPRFAKSDTTDALT